MKICLYFYKIVETYRQFGDGNEKIIAIPIRIITNNVFDDDKY